MDTTTPKKIVTKKATTVVTMDCPFCGDDVDIDLEVEFEHAPEKGETEIFSADMCASSYGHQCDSREVMA